MKPIKVNAQVAIYLPPIEYQREMAARIRKAHIEAEVLLRQSLEAVKLAKKFRTSSIHKILGGPQGAYSRAWDRTFRQNPPNTIRELIKVKQNDRHADFWIQRRGSKHLVGRPKDRFSQYDLGVTVLRKDILDPDWLFYMTEYAHTLGLFKTASKGTLPLQHVTIPDVYRVLTGVLTGYKPNPAGDAYMEEEKEDTLKWKMALAIKSYSHSSKTFRRLYEDWKDETGPRVLDKALKKAVKAHKKFEKARNLKSIESAIKSIVDAKILMTQASHEIYRYVPGSPILGATFGTAPEIPKIITHKNLAPLLEALEQLVTDEGLWDMAHQDQKHWINRKVTLEFPIGELAKEGLHTLALIGFARPKPVPLTGKEGFDAQGLEGKVQTRRTLKDAIIQLRGLPPYRGRIVT